MSDSYLHKLEDIAWDDFCLNDDHIVPHPSCEHANELMSSTDSRKKPRCEVTGLSNSVGDQSTQKYANQWEDKEHPPLNSRSTTMLEKYSRLEVPDGMFPSKHDKEFVKEVSSSTSENSWTPNHCISSNNIESTRSSFFPNGPTVDDKNAAVGENSYHLGPISQADDDLDIFNSNHEDKGTNDLLYYNWPEIENFEDVDRIFRSCDSTFGLGASIEDDLGWFSSSDVIEGSGSGLRSDFEFPCPASSALESISRCKEGSGPKEAGSFINDSGTKDQPLSHNGRSVPSEEESAILSHLSFVDGSSDSDRKIVPQKKINMHKMHSKHQNRTQGKSKDVCLENGETFDYNDNLPKEVKQPTAINGTQMDLTCTGIQQQRQVDGPEFGYIQGGFSYLHSDYSHSDQTTVRPMQSTIKYENSSLVPLPAKDSCATNQVQWMESSPDPSFQADIGNEKKVDELLQHPGMKLENNSDLEGVSMGTPAELRSSIVEESPLISSGVPEISEEAASFHHLQHVMERLDTRTKLCIRDSLYRLAQSAEQRHRHQHANLNNGSGETSGAFVDIGANRCTGYLDMETDTNSIDRSIAHLLFHRPSNSSVMPDSDSLALKSPSMIYGSLATRQMMGGNLTSTGENAAETDRGMADH